MTAAITTRTHRALQWTSENNKEVSKTYLCQLKGPLKVRGGKIRPVLKTTTQQSSMNIMNNTKYKYRISSNQILDKNVMVVKEVIVERIRDCISCIIKQKD